VFFVPYQRGDSGVPQALSKLQRSCAVISLEVDVTASHNELFCDGRMPSYVRVVEQRAPMLVLVVDEGLRTLCRQQRANLRCVTTTHGLAKLLPRHSFTH
jgi:hypothetical protein